MAFNPSFEGLTSTQKSTGLRVTPVKPQQQTSITTQNQSKPIPSQRAHA